MCSSKWNLFETRSLNTFEKHPVEITNGTNDNVKEPDDQRHDVIMSTKSIHVEYVQNILDSLWLQT